MNEEFASCQEKSSAYILLPLSNLTDFWIAVCLHARRARLPGIFCSHRNLAATVRAAPKDPHRGIVISHYEHAHPSLHFDPFFPTDSRAPLSQADSEDSAREQASQQAAVVTGFVSPMYHQQLGLLYPIRPKPMA